MKKQESGFTLVELVIVFSSAAILSAVGIAGFNNFNQTQSLQYTAIDLVNTLNLAKSRALSQTKPTSLPSGFTCDVLRGWEVHTFATKQYSLQADCEPSVPSNFVKKLPKSLTFDNACGGKKPSIFFPVLTGGVVDHSKCTPVLTPPLKIVLRAGSSTTKTIIVNQVGGITVL